MRYKKAYEQWWHTLLGIKVGLPVPHSVLSQEKICWRFCNVKVPKSAGAWERKVQRPLDKFARNWHKSLDQWRLEGAPDDDVGRDLPATPPAGQSPSSVPSRWVKASPKKGGAVKGKKWGKVQSMAAKKAAAGEEAGNDGNDDSSSSDDDDEDDDDDEEDDEDSEEGEDTQQSEEAKATRAAEAQAILQTAAKPTSASTDTGLPSRRSLQRAPEKQGATPPLAV